jgi:hypothetical protein
LTISVGVAPRPCRRSWWRRIRQRQHRSASQGGDQRVGAGKRAACRARRSPVAICSRCEGPGCAGLRPADRRPPPRQLVLVRRTRPSHAVAAQAEEDVADEHETGR